MNLNGYFNEYTLICFFALYVLLAFVMSILIRADISLYKRRINLGNSYNLTLMRYLHTNEKTLIIVGSILFPLYICLSYGMWFASKIYNILIDNKDENRFASWFV
jgi:hypothetical protein